MDQTRPEQLRGISLTCPLRKLRLQTGEKVKIPVGVLNGSETAIDSLPPYPIHISYHWLDPSGCCQIFHGKRTPLIQPLLPGEVRTTKMFLESPGKEGKYSLKITLVQEGCFWFEDFFPGFCTSVPDVLVTKEQTRTYANFSLDALNDGNLRKAQFFFQKDQESLGNCVSAETNFICPVSSVKSWCSEHNLSFYHLEGPARRAVFRPRLAGQNRKQEIPGEVVLPEAYLAEVHDAVITGGHAPVLVGNGVALYDEYLHKDWDRFNFDQDDHIFIGNYRNALQCDFEKGWGDDIGAGILLLGSYSNNYYHWVVDYLSRFWAIDQFPEYSHFPLIIDDNLHPNLLEALSYCNKNRRVIIPVRYGTRHRVKKLVIPSNLSFIPKNLRSGMKGTYEDGGVAPRAIQFLRDIFEVNKRIENSESRRKIFISRKRAHHRVLLNETEIENLFLRYGFQTINPEKMTFREQLEIFAGAEIIAGPSGAGMTNMIFAPITTKLLFLSNCPFYSVVADILGQDAVYVSGSSISCDNIGENQQNFVVPVEDVNEAIISFCGDTVDTPGSFPGTDTSSAYPYLLEKKVFTAFSVDRINGEDPQKNSHRIQISGHRDVIIEGWAIDSCSGTPAETVYIVFDTGLHDRTYYSLRRTDVARHFNNDSLEYSGFISIIPSGKLPVGDHTFSLHIVAHDRSGYYRPDERFSIEIVRE